MVASHDRREGGLKAPFGLGILMLLLLPSEVGYQDLAALIARAPPIVARAQNVDRAQKGALASTFGTIHQAKLSMPRPVGAMIPPTLGYTLAGLDPNNADITGSIRERVLGESALLADPSGGPTVDRSRKGDYGVARNSDRAIALKGDRLKSMPRVDIAQIDVNQADVTRRKEKPEAAPRTPSVAQQDVGPPLSLVPPIATAQAQKQVQEQVQEQADEQAIDAPAPSDGYALASAGEHRVAGIAPKRADAGKDGVAVAVLARVRALRRDAVVAMLARARERISV